MDLPELIIRSHSDLADAFKAIKEHLSLSNEQLDAIRASRWRRPINTWGLVASRTIGSKTFEFVAWRFGGPPPRRDRSRPGASRGFAVGKTKNRGSPKVPADEFDPRLDRAKPVILSEMARKGWQTRQRQARRNGNGHAARR